MPTKFAVYRGKPGRPIADPAFGGDPNFRWRLVGWEHDPDKKPAPDGPSRSPLESMRPAWRVHKWAAELDHSVAKGELEKRGPAHVVAESADEAAKKLAEHLAHEPANDDHQDADESPESNVDADEKGS